MSSFRSVPCSTYKSDVLKFVQDLRESNSSAWKCLREMTEEKSYKSYLMLMIEDMDDRYDIYLKGLVTFLEKIPSWNYDDKKGSGTNSLIFYVLRIIKNKAGDYWREKYRRGEISKSKFDAILNKNREEEEEEEGVEQLEAGFGIDPSWSEELYKALEKCQEGLSDEHYDIIERREFMGQSYEAISLETGILIGTLRQRYSMAIKRLRECMKNKNFD